MVSGNRDEVGLAELLAMNEMLHPDLEPWVEESEVWGPMLRHPLLYSIPLALPGLVNRQYEHKRELLVDAIADEDWHRVVFLHERPYRLRALVNYCVGRDERDDEPLPLAFTEQWVRDLAADVWVDSENIEQCIRDWRLLFGNGEHGLWLGTPAERAEFDALPTVNFHGAPCIRAWRGGSVGDWSWTTNRKIAQFFSRRSGLPVRGHLIPVADVFGYLTRRGESELLVKYTEFRSSLVYPNGAP